MADEETLNLEPNEATFYSDDSNQTPPPDIVTFNESRSCADLTRMHKEGKLEIQPDFQRHVVWKKTQQTRFIDSLIKGLPIPSMCFSHDYSTGKWQVIDGLQRISAIIAFLSDDAWRLSNIADVDPQIAGKWVKDFRTPDTALNKFYGRVQDITIPVNVIRCDLNKESHSNFLFTIFHRLNTGGMRLTNQEIRNCIFGGDFNKLLIRLCDNPTWQRLTKVRSVDRFQGEELILRFFAFRDRLNDYSGRLARFLNDYMRDNRMPAQEWLKEREDIFYKVIQILDLMIEESGRETSTVLEALMFGVAANEDSLKALEQPRLRELVLRLKSDVGFIEKSSGQALAAREKVQGRLADAASILRP